MMKIEYIKELFYQGEIEFTGTGHVDMDAFDENHHTEIQTVATFYDEEAESLCRPVLEAYGAQLEKRNKDEPECDILTFERKVIKDNDLEGKKLDISFFWGVKDWEYSSPVLDCGSCGFDPTDYGWAEDATDINDKPYDWATDNLFSQVPKEEDFILVCQKEIAQELRFGFNKDTDGSPEENADEAITKMQRMIILHRNLYNRDWDAESQKWFWD
tara:strand:+ start:112 stop:756 length:645 start_codon:yes stop_codon:yes gene_type:complete